MKKDWFLVFSILAVLSGIFFYKTILYGLLPFPSDLLVAEYNPWKTYSYLGYIPGSFPNKAQYFDVLRQLYPWKTVVLESLKQGQMPLWNPYNFSGAPLLANFQSAVFYPLSILYFLLPQILSWTILVMLQPLLALLFTFFYARKIGISRLGAIFSAFSFAFSSFMTVWLEYNTIGQAILWLPLSLLSIEYLLEKKEIKWILIFVFALLSSLLAGHVQIFFYLLVFLAIYFLFRNKVLNKKNFNKELSLFSLLTILSLGIGAVQLIPGLELVNESARSPHAYDFLVNKILIQPWQLIMFIVSDFFGNPATRNYWLTDTYVGKVTSIGVVAIIFVLSGIFSKKNPIKKFFLWAALIILILVTNNPLTQLIYRINLPLISGSAPTLSIFLFCFALSLLAGFGIDVLAKERVSFRKYLYLILPIMAIFAFLLTITLFLQKTNLYGLGSNLGISLRNLYYASTLIAVSALLLALAVRNKKLCYLLLVVLLLINIFDLWRGFLKFNPFTPKKLVFPKAEVLSFLQREAGVNRFWGYGTANVEANFASYYRLFSPDGYDPLYPKRYGEFIQSSKDGKVQTQFNVQTRSDAVIFNDFGEIMLSSNKSRLKVLDLLGVKYVLDRVENNSTQNTFPIDRFKLLYDEKGWKIFENKKALPRAFLVSDYKIANNAVEFERLFFAKDFDPLKTIILDQKPERGLNNIYHLSDTRVESYMPNEIRISTKTDGDGLLFLSDAYYPGWKAYVDEKQTKIYRADYAFRAVFIPKGEHTVKFSFEPRSFEWGYKVTLISAILFLTFLFLARKTRKAGI